MPADHSPLPTVPRFADFHISGLKRAEFAALFGLSEAELAARHIRRIVADEAPGFPCRISLRDAAIGESLLLLNYEHQSAATPYRARHAIFLREAAEDAELSPGEVPESLRLRLLSLRAFDAAGMMIGADIVEGAEIETLIGKLFADPRVAYLHAHNARPGCYAARIDRAIAPGA